MTEKKFFPSIETALGDALHYLFTHKSSGTRVVEYVLKRQKKWGSRDRRLFAETFYSIIRDFNFLYFKSHGFIPKSDEFTEEEVAKIVSFYISGNSPEGENHDIPPWVKFSLNQVLHDRLAEELAPKKLTDFLKMSQQQAPVFIRANASKTTAPHLLEELSSEGVFTEPLSDHCLKLKERKNLFGLSSFKKGLYEIQDFSSQLVAPFLEPEPGMRVVDSCAGAGGKTLHLSALMENRGKIIAMDIHQRRLEELKKRARRVGASNIETREITSSKIIKRLERSADRVLLDVPCSGSGVYRRKPEGKLFFDPLRLKELQSIQEEILNGHSNILKEGGVLVYSTCSVLPSENSKQIERFLSKNKNFELLKEVSVPVGKNDGDGFYMARIKRLS